MIRTATAWPSNAALIVDLVLLGYLDVDARTLDPTYGNGKWWALWRPLNLVTHDIRLDGRDFRNLPEPSGSFQQIAFDPPYVCTGGRRSSSRPDIQADYGMLWAPTRPSGLQQVINDGLKEMSRLLAPGGVLLVKCQDYVSDHKLWLGTHWTLTYALGLGLECVDRLEHVSKSDHVQPPRARQYHARRNLSTMFVFRKPKAKL